MNMDYSPNGFVKSNSYSTDIDYPSENQALFTLAVMVIVLLFILVYCCSGASPCSNTDISSTEVTSVLPDVTRRVLRNSVQPRTQRPGSREQNVTRGDHRSRSPAVIVPMMCSGDENYNGPYHSKGKRKPPAYEDLYQAPPPYATRTHTPSPNQVAVFPPPYEDSCKDCKLTFDLENCFDYLREASFSKNPDNASKSESETPGRTDPPAETASSPTLSAIITMSGADIPMSGADIPLSGADTPMLGAGIPMLGAETPMLGSDIPLSNAGTPLSGASTAMPSAGIQRERCRSPKI
ncbi:uncharacterized protein LOC108682739 isoform X2 [Hyalella azteca]|uniref:Uncharacterized protein LOC108682739 isoform X2 n=1 Tax=Hyalella azteca TaxID=294128 RepID=A0A8B7PNA4_HYAAZ|nr:uncharacterized protein LOC108682739 isoform X2 [Hyalella azteca]